MAARGGSGGQVTPARVLRPRIVVKDRSDPGNCAIPQRDVASGQIRCRAKATQAMVHIAVEERFGKGRVAVIKGEDRLTFPD